MKFVYTLLSGPVGLGGLLLIVNFLDPIAPFNHLVCH